jgi:protein TorT
VKKTTIDFNSDIGEGLGFWTIGDGVDEEIMSSITTANIATGFHAGDLSYIAGTAVTAEAAQSILRDRGVANKVKVMAFYMTPGVYDGIKRGTILAAPADSMVIQGRIAIDQAVRLLEDKSVVRHVGPKIFIVDQKNISSVSRDDILPPDSFKPQFNVY